MGDKIMKLISPFECRQIIADIPNNQRLQQFISQMQTPKPFNINDCQKFYETMYLLALRTGETCGCKTPADPNKNTGNTLKAETATYQPDPTINEEIDNLTRLIYAKRLREGNENPPSYKDILSIKEPIAFFYVQVEKRKDLFIRKTAIPLNTEPLAKPVLNYILERQSDPPIFPVNRQQALRLAHIIFEGCQYKIKAYRRNLLDKNKKPILNEKRKPERYTVPNGIKTFGDHAIRHLSLEEKKKQGIRGPYLKAFVGWTPKSEETLEETYASETYRCYMPFLLMQKTL